MTLVRHQNGWAISVSFVAALGLSIIPIPDWAQAARPEWVAMALIYWCMALPQRVGVGTGWVMGLLEDVAKGTLLGQHALAFTLVAFLTLRLHQRLRIYPLWQQSMVVMVLIALEQMLVLWVKGITGEPPDSWGYWLPSLTSALLWSWVFLILRDLRRRCRVT